MSHAATELSTPPLMAMSAPGRREVFCVSVILFLFRYNILKQ